MKNLQRLGCAHTSRGAGCISRENFLTKQTTESAKPNPPNGTIRVGGRQVTILDPRGIEVVSADLITEAREFNGICALSFATVVETPNANGNGNGSGAFEGIVCARLRLSLVGALNLRNMLDKMLKKTMPAKRDTH
jgi:hypothetical protein